MAAPMKNLCTFWKNLSLQKNRLVRSIYLSTTRASQIFERPILQLRTLNHDSNKFTSQCQCVTATTNHRLMSTDVQAQSSTEPETDTLYRQVDLEIKGHDDAVLTSYTTFLSLAAGELDIFIANMYTPMKIYDRQTVLKSAFVHKKHRVQYEMRTHYRVIRLKHITGSTCDTYLEYIQRNLPEGVAMKVTRHRLETLAPHLTPPTAPQSHDTHKQDDT